MKKFIKYLQSVRLSEKEKSLLRYRLQEFISFNPIRNERVVPKKSFYFSVFTLRSLSKGLALVLIILVVVGGTGVSYASTDALPGDKLYPIKVNVNEKIEETLALGAEAKVHVQTQKVERRLTEAQKLADTNKLSVENKKIVKAHLEKNVAEMTKTIVDLSHDGKIEAALDVTSKITPVLEAHKEVFVEKDNLDSTQAKMAVMADSMTEEDSESLLDTVNAAIKKVEEAEETVINSATDDMSVAAEVTQKNTEEAIKKIEGIKKEKEGVDVSNTSNAEEAEVSAETQMESSTTFSSLPSSDKSTLSVEQAAQMKTFASFSLAPEKTYSEEDIETKIQVAEDLLKRAEYEKGVGHYREALILSQSARKIIQQIEEYRKIKEAPQVIKTEIKSTLESTEINKTPTQVIEPEKEKESSVEEKESETSVVPPIVEKIDLKAEAIKSLEETTSSFKKLNMGSTLEAQTRLQ